VRLRSLAPVLALLSLASSFAPKTAAAESALPAPLELSSNWQLQDASKITQPGAQISAPAFTPNNWYAATVPGTVLTSLVNDKVYPEPLYGENNRPDKIPESLARAQYWYRTTFTVPKNYKGEHIWLNFEGINYASEIWLNGQQIGTTRGAFIRGTFDISSNVKPGQSAVLAVLVSPQPHPGDPHEHTIANGLGLNGGITALDGPTFLSTIGWDWIPAIRDRDTGIWRKVFLSASGPVLVKDPLITTDLPLPKVDTADVAVKATLENITDTPQKGILKGTFGDLKFEREITLDPKSKQTISFDPTTTPALHIANPKLWWPNGYGAQYLYPLHLTFEVQKHQSDSYATNIGVRKITYFVSDSENLTLSVNGVRIFIRGGDWGLDEALKRIPRERLEAQIRMHQLANMNLIRNWVGQSTGEDFYELCDKYGILLWDEFFQPNPSDGPNPTDLDTYLANVRDKILRFRNHPSIAVWCARNEGFPPKNIDDPLRVLMAELEPTRRYQPSSTDGQGVHSGGPYYWRTPREFYEFDEAFKTEIGSVSVPTLESIHGMMPQKDWETINDDWAEHDLAHGAQHGNTYPLVLASRYGKIANLADFVRKAQLANYEAFRSMYEGRNAKLFKPSTAVITWMSNPAQPSFVWQLYHHDLEPNASLFAVKKSGEMVHVQWNESTGPNAGQVEVVNNLPTPLTDAKVHLTLYNLDGKVAAQQDFAANAAPSTEADLGKATLPDSLSPVYFVKLELHDKTGKLLSDNFYWHEQQQDNLQALETLAPVTLDAKATKSCAASRCQIQITLHNSAPQVALMVHLQLRRKQSNERVLPVFYSDNYLSLVPNEDKTITIDVAESDLKGDTPLILLDGFNVTGATFTSKDVLIAPNVEAQVNHWPVTGLPILGEYTGPQ